MEDQKKRLLQELYQRHTHCAPCPFLHENACHRVFGEGNVDATIMLIGEAPGADEDRLKRPFVGRAGRLLDRMLGEVGIARESVFITNIVKCRPPQNRTPLPHEITLEIKALLRSEIELIRPRVICTLGAVATGLFMPHCGPLGAVRGTSILFKELQLILLPTYHPAYILRNISAMPIVLADLQKAIDFASKPL